MKIIKATFEQIFFTGQIYLNQRLGGEVLLEEGETLENAWAKMKEDAIAFHKKEYPHLYEEFGHMSGIPGSMMHVSSRPITPPPYGMSEPIPEVKVERPKNSQDAIIFDINSVTDAKVLESYRLMAKTNPAINEAYQNKLKELS